MKVIQRHHKTLVLAILASLVLASMPADLGVDTNRRLRAGDRKNGEEVAEQVMTRGRVDVLGSTPPTCRSKCGRCAPCTPVHVPIQPRLCTPSEYYPESWRCECADKLFMP